MYRPFTVCLIKLFSSIPSAGMDCFGYYFASMPYCDFAVQKAPDAWRLTVVFLCHCWRESSFRKSRLRQTMIAATMIS
jgi:hypothetical protein